MTVTGPVESSAVGQTMMHEHLMSPVNDYSMSGFASGMDDVDIAIEEVLAYKAAGGSVIVEVGTRRPRYIEQVRQISEATGVLIVKGTGHYTLPTYPPEVFERTVVQLADSMTRELTEGIDGTTWLSTSIRTPATRALAAACAGLA